MEIESFAIGGADLTGSLVLASALLNVELRLAID